MGFHKYVCPLLSSAFKQSWNKLESFSKHFEILKPTKIISALILLSHQHTDASNCFIVHCHPCTCAMKIRRFERLQFYVCVFLYPSNLKTVLHKNYYNYMPMKSVPIPYSSHLINNKNMAKVRISRSEVTLTFGFYNDAW